MRYDKLVRDRIPEIIIAEGKSFTTRVVSGDELKAKLADKLHEEAREFFDSWTVEELADLSEVIRALSVIIGSSPEQVEWVRRNKAIKKGGFSEGIVLKEVKEA